MTFEESTTADRAERSRRAIEAVGRRDFDAAMASYGPDSVWDTSPLGMGTYQGIAAIRSAFEEWAAVYDEFEVEIEELQDLGGGVVLIVARQRGRVAGSTSYVEFRYASITEWTGTLIGRVTPFTDIDEARAAAERLAVERSLAMSENPDSG